MQDTHSCVGCDEGFALTPINGTADTCGGKAGSLCQSCVTNICSCEHGSGHIGDGCPEHGAAVCRSCDDGYHLNGTMCVANTCTCKNGYPAQGEACTLDGGNTCSACFQANPAPSPKCVGPGRTRLTRPVWPCLHNLTVRMPVSICIRMLYLGDLTAIILVFIYIYTSYTYTHLCTCRTSL